MLTSAIAFLTYRNNYKSKSDERLTDTVRRDTTISTKLDMIITGTTELKNEIKSINNKLDEMNERIAKCEMSTKLAHNRIDKLESRF